MNEVKSKFQKPDWCKQCPWYHTSTGYVPPFGSCSNGVMLVGMAPEVAEIEQGEPFVGRAGDVLRRAMRWVPAKKEEYGIINAVQCRPRDMELCDNPGWEDAVAHCKSLRDVAEQIWKPKVLVAAGADALGVYTGRFTIERTRGYRFDRPGLCPTIGTYHPAFVGRGNMALLFTLRYDLQTAVAKAKADWGSSPKTFKLHPKPEEFKAWVKANMDAEWIVVDIETPWSKQKDEEELHLGQATTHIVRVGFCSSKDPTYAITEGWYPPYSTYAMPLLAAEMDKVFWNSAFDKTRLELNGYKVNGKVVDAMWLWHFLQPDLPKALAHVATYFTDLPEWKSESEQQPEYYNCCDVYSEAQCYIAIVKKLKQHGMWEIAQRHVTDLLRLLEKIKNRGMKVDVQKLAVLRQELAEALAKMDLEILKLYPESLCKTKWYKITPKEVKNGQACEGTVGIRAKKPGKFVKDGDRWGFRWDFNPNAPQQLIKYLQACGYKLYRKKGKSTISTEAKYLDRILKTTGDLLVAKMLERRLSEKIFSTYTQYPVDENGYAHPTLTLNTATGRLACERPNLQNIPRSGELADRVRECFTASEGHTLVAADWTGMESFLTGYFAGDEDYMKLSKMNIYAYVSAKKYNWDMPGLHDAHLVEVLKKYKQKSKSTFLPGESHSVYDKFKAIVLGLSYGEGPKALVENNPGVFKNRAEAARMKKEILDMFPKIRQWQAQVLSEAGKEGKLFNPYMYVRWLLDVPGEQSPTALAQKSQSTGAAMSKDDMLYLDEKTKIGQYLVLQVHDELVLDVPNKEVPAACSILKEVMERARPELGGQRIMVTIKTGPNLRDLA